MNSNPKYGFPFSFFKNIEVKDTASFVVLVSNSRVKPLAVVAMFSKFGDIETANMQLWDTFKVIFISFFDTGDAAKCQEVFEGRKCLPFQFCGTADMVDPIKDFDRWIEDKETFGFMNKRSLIVMSASALEPVHIMNFLLESGLDYPSTEVKKTGETEAMVVFSDSRHAKKLTEISFGSGTSITFTHLPNKEATLGLHLFSFFGNSMPDTSKCPTNSYPVSYKSSQKLPWHKTYSIERDNCKQENVPYDVGPKIDCLSEEPFGDISHRSESHSWEKISLKNQDANGASSSCTL